MKRLGIVFGLAVASATAFAFARADWPWRRPPVAPAIVVDRAYHETSDTLQPGETLSEVFARQGVSDFNFAAADSERGLDPRRVRAGLVFHFRQLTTDTAPTRISVRRSAEERLHYERVGRGWEARSEDIRWRGELVTVDGPIGDALYLALDASISDEVLESRERVRLAGNLADIYDWTVDFTRDIRPGDAFRVLFERMVSEEGEVRLGRIHASDLTVTGKRLPAYRFDNGRGSVGYFDDQGRSLRRAFLRAPLEFRRISSRFSSARRHPILGRVRRHAGTDYAADRGTPVRATADGVVRRAGRVNSYGNLIELRHQKGITTRYGHLSRIAVSPGTRVTQGQVIGYVGATGLANGPHLHYEFRVNGVPKDHRRVDLGDGEPVPDDDRDAFERERERLQHLLQPATDSLVTAAAG